VLQIQNWARGEIPGGGKSIFAFISRDEFLLGFEELDKWIPARKDTRLKKPVSVWCDTAEIGPEIHLP